MTWVAVENRHPKNTCYDEIILCAQNIGNHLSFDISYDWEDQCGCLFRRKIVILTTFKFSTSIDILELEMTIFVIPNCSLEMTIFFVES